MFTLMRYGFYFAVAYIGVLKIIVRQVVEALLAGQHAFQEARGARTSSSPCKTSHESGCAVAADLL